MVGLCLGKILLKEREVCLGAGSSVVRRRGGLGWGSFRQRGFLGVVGGQFGGEVGGACGSLGCRGRGEGLDSADVRIFGLCLG